MIEFIKKHLPTIITVGVCVVLCVVVLIIQAISHASDLKEKTYTAYLKGKSEVLIEQSELLIDGVNKSLIEFKARIDEYKSYITIIKEVSKDVSDKVNTILTRINELDNAYKTLFSAWSNSKRK